CYKRERSVSDILSDVSRFITQLMTSAGSQVIFRVSRDKQDLQNFENTIEAIDIQSKTLASKLEAQKMIGAESREFSRIYQMLRKSIEKGRQAVDSQDRVDAMVAYVHLRKAIAKINGWSQTVSRKLDEERDIAAQQQIALKERVLYIIFGGIAFNIILLIGSVYYFDKRTGRRFNQLMDNIMSLGFDRELKYRVAGSDDFASLDKVLHNVDSAVREMRRTEQSIIENAVDVICSLDATGHFTQVNPALERLLKLSSEDLLGKSLLSLVASADTSRTFELLQETIKSGSSGSFELTLRTRDGQAVEMLWNAFWSDDMQKLFCVAHNITARKQLERMKGDFVAMISHDVKSPLTSLQLTLGVLTSGKLGEIPNGVTTRIERAQNSVTHIIHLINDLLEMEKLESGVFDLVKASIDVKEMLATASGLVEESARKQQITIEIKASDDRVVCDEARMIRVFTNLLSNAIKFSDQNSTIYVDFMVKNNVALFEVKDSGRGIPAEKIEQIFERYKQVDVYDEHVKKGSGLGLAICKAIVEAHAGSITVTSSLGKGSTFLVSIPC
ncbi:MAG: PAS domain S-box protein, partial [Leptolyngbya sp.]|nr:PAS domain S-box protein [Candidatus Melainabacteria bacterium]